MGISIPRMIVSIPRTAPHSYFLLVQFYYHYHFQTSCLLLCLQNRLQNGLQNGLQRHLFISSISFTEWFIKTFLSFISFTSSFSSGLVVFTKSFWPCCVLQEKRLCSYSCSCSTSGQEKRLCSLSIPRMVVSIPRTAPHSYFLLISLL